MPKRICAGLFLAFAALAASPAVAASARVEAQIAAFKAKARAAVAAAPAFDPAALDSPPVIWRVPGGPAELRDAPYAPQMVVVPPGEYTWGSGPAEPGRRPDAPPRQRVRIGYGLAVSKYPVTVGEFARFVADTRRAVPNDCWTMESGVRDSREGRSWKAPGFAQTARSPVVCVRWEDARAYAAWLARKTGRGYRLLSDAEYEYVSRAGTTTAYWWGEEAGKGHANCMGCGGPRDGKGSSPVGGFAPNPFGLFDIAGNVWSWLGDCVRPGEVGVPPDGSPRSVVNCDTPGLRGGSWDMEPGFLHASLRAGYPSGNHFSIGFRVARAL